MDRVEALTYLQSLGFYSLMAVAKRPETDTPNGYGPALDSAFSFYSVFKGAALSEVVDADVPGFRELLAATVYDLVVPTVCVYVDTQTDAPLTKVSGSQLCRQTLKAQENAWIRAGAYGYGGENQVGGFRVGLDFLDAPTEDSGE